MKMRVHSLPKIRDRQLAFTLTEMIVAVSIGMLVMGAAMAFLDFSGKYISGITAQSIQNERAALAMERLQDRARLATKLSIDSTGNVLTLGYDTNFTMDSDVPKDGIAYNDSDYQEQFQFRNGDGNDSTFADNSLIYIPLVGAAKTNILVPSSVRKLPGENVFTFATTNLNSTVLVRFGLIDTYARDHYQAIDMRSAIVSLNRPAITNVITILQKL